MAYDDGPLQSPLILTRPMLLHWVRSVMDGNNDSSTFQRLEEIPVYQQMRDNPELLKRLRAVLEANEIVSKARERRGYLFTKSAFAKIKNLVTHRAMAKRKIESLIAERQKAHDAYEMLRKLSFDDPEGLVFKLQFD